MASILIADDHPVVLQGLVALLDKEAGLEVVSTATRGSEVLEQLEQTPVDLLILDVHMPDLNGVEVSGLVRKRYPDLKTLVLSTSHEPSMVKKMLKNGIRGYLVKDEESEELLAAVHAILAGEHHFSKAIKTAFIEEFMPDRPRKISSPSIELSKREQEVLLLTAREFTAQEIGEQLFISEATVISHKRNLLRKFEVRNAVGMIRKAMQMGLLE